MFDSLTEKLKKALSLFSKAKELNEAALVDASRKVRLALLDADVNYSVATQLVSKIKEKAIGQKIIKSVKPTEQFIKIVHDELVELMGKEESSLNFRGNPSVFFLVGLQGSGKTTSSIKLAYYLQNSLKKKPLVAACDLQRPAAIEQLHVLGKNSSVEVFSIEKAKNPLEVAKQAILKAQKEGFEVVIIDTAGRLHVDLSLMEELKNMKEALDPSEVLFVANATQGQDILRSVLEFDQKIGITGSILTMLDGDARAGAAISIKEVTQKPLKFEGVGEKVGDFQLFHPRSMADRILGMGDVINLVRKAEESFSEEEKEKMEKKIKKASFNFTDYLEQLTRMKSMGSLSSLIKMVPGASSMIQDFSASEAEMKLTEAIILSMTLQEREGKEELNFSRRKRIALGSGVKKEKVDQLINKFEKAKKMMKKLPKMGKNGPDLESFNPMGNVKWR